MRRFLFLGITVLALVTTGVAAAAAAVAQPAGAATTVERFTTPIALYSSCTDEFLRGTADVVSVYDFSRDSDPAHPFFHQSTTYKLFLRGEQSGTEYTGNGHQTEVFSGRFFGDTESEAFVEPVTLVLRSSDGVNVILHFRTVTVVTPSGELTVAIDNTTATCT